MFTTVREELSPGAINRVLTLERVAAITVSRVNDVVGSSDSDRPTDLRDTARKTASTASDNASHPFGIESISQIPLPAVYENDKSGQIRPLSGHRRSKRCASGDPHDEREAA